MVNMFVHLLSGTSAVEFLVNVELEWLHRGQHHNKSKVKLGMGWYCFMVDSHNVCYIFTSQLEIVDTKILIPQPKHVEGFYMAEPPFHIVSLKCIFFSRSLIFG